MTTGAENDAKYYQTMTSLEDVQSKFPKDDLQLFTSDQQRTNVALRRRRSAPSSSILKSLTRSRRQSDGSENADGAAAAGTDDAVENKTVEHKKQKNKHKRQYILESSVVITKEIEALERYLFLLTDLLIIAKLKSRSTYKLKARIPLADVWVAPASPPAEDDVTVDGALASQRSLVIGWPLTNHMVTFSSPQEKDAWQAALSRHTQMIKKKEQPQHITVKVSYKQLSQNDLNQVITSTIRVENTERADDTLRRCIDKFHIQGACASDYQLWVLCEKDGSFFPLTGHEHIYAIGMAQVRDAAALEPTADAHGLMNTPLRLKLSKKDNQHDQPDDVRENDVTPQRAQKASTKKSPLDFFKRHRSPAPPRTFGQPLSSVCVDGDLPQLLLELILELLMKAPYTQGVFRKSANQRAVRELREKICAQRATAMDDIPVLVLAACFKDFLRSIPGSLLDCDLYEDWVASLAIPDATTRILRVKWLVSRLPQQHQLVLGYTLAVLHGVSSRAYQNQMNAFNLAICVGQSLLWPRGEETADIAAATRDVPSVVQHLIENSLDVIGREKLLSIGKHIAMKTLPESSSELDNFQLASDVSKPPSRLDSSLESLELLTSQYSADSLPSDPLQLSFGNVSRDSGLSDVALSDTFVQEDDVTSSSQSAPSTPMTTVFASENDLTSIGWSSIDSNMDIPASPNGTPVAPPRRRRCTKLTPTLARRGSGQRDSLSEEPHTHELAGSLTDLSRERSSAHHRLRQNTSSSSLPTEAEVSKAAPVTTSDVTQAVKPTLDRNANLKSTESSRTSLPQTSELGPKTDVTEAGKRPLVSREGIIAAPQLFWSAIPIEDIDGGSPVKASDITLEPVQEPLPAKSPFERRTSAQRWRGDRVQRRTRPEVKKSFVEITDSDIVEQTTNSAKARELYQQSMRLNDGDTESPGETVTSSEPPASHYNTNNRRAAGMDRKTPRRRSRRTRKRLSDSAIQHAKKKDKRGQTDVRRSKSDTCEHLSKIVDLKTLCSPLPLSQYEPRPADKENFILLDEDQQAALEDAGRRRRSSVTSLANRNWHKDLSQQYEAPPTSATIQRATYQYRGAHAQTPNGRRRWTPPAHPSKDLVIQYVKEPMTSHTRHNQRV